MTEEYLYDPKKEVGNIRLNKGKNREKLADELMIQEKHLADGITIPKSSEWLNPLLVYAGAAMDSYLTTKKPAGIAFDTGMQIPSAGGSSVNVPYLELGGLAGSFLAPPFIKGKMGKMLGNFLTGIGANGVSKIADPKDEMKAQESNEAWEVKTCL